MLRRASGLLVCAALTSCTGDATNRSGAPSTGGASVAVAAVAALASEPAVTGSPRRLRLISSDQYVNSLAYVFGDDIRLDTHFAPLPRTAGLLENGAASAGVTANQLEQYQRIAAAVAARVVDPDHRAILVPCTPRSATATDPACAGQFLTSVGRLIYRRPLTAAQGKALVAQADEAADRLHDFYGGLELALEGNAGVQSQGAVHRRHHRGRSDQTWSSASRFLRLCHSPQPLPVERSAGRKTPF